jgi:predicted kinase
VRDWVVRMARVPAEDFLDIQAASGGLTPSLLDQIADAVAEFHMSLPPMSGIRPDMEAIAQGNVTSALTAGLPEEEVIAWRDAMLSGLAAIRSWHDARTAAGFIRRCHGDLHLGNLCLWRGRPVPFDALEFDETLGTIDVTYDLAFLLMDLEHRLNRAAANRVFNRYVARTGDADLVTGLPVCLSMRAMIRAHVEARSGRPGEVDTYLAAAPRYLKPPPPVVVALGGLPGSGKSTIARALAPSLGAAPGALVPRSDEIRKRQHGVRPEQRLPPSAYTEQKSMEVFSEIARMAEVAAKGGHAVIADATFMDQAHRSMVEAAAKRAGSPFLGFWLTAPLAELERRIAARVGDASDATVAVLHAAAANDPGPGDWRAVDASDAATVQSEVLTLAKALG